MNGSLVIIIVLVILSAAFSGAEISLTSLSPAKIRTFKNDKRFGSSAIYKLKKKPENLLITILIGNNLVNILATVVATIWGVRTFGSGAIGAITGILTFIVLIFGEITPKTIAQKYAEGFARIISYPLLGFMYAIYPVTWLLHKFIHSLMKLFKAKHPIRTITEEELLAMVDIGTKEGVIEEQEQEFIENVLEFTDTSVEEVMTIEKDIEAVQTSMTIQQASHFFVEHSHTRIPVFKGDLNNVIGILTVHDILHLIHNSRGADTLGDIHYQKVIVVPKTKSISKLFREFQKRRQHLAIVVDEHGDTVGLVTMEDILEEIVGDIADEQDREDKGIRNIEKNEWEIDGDAIIEDINEALKIELDYPEHKTIGLLILEKLQRFPRKGEKLEYDNLSIQVKEMGEKKIEKVIINKLPEKTGGTEENN